MKNYYMDNAVFKVSFLFLLCLLHVNCYLFGAAASDPDSDLKKAMAASLAEPNDTIGILKGMDFNDNDIRLIQETTRLAEQIEALKIENKLSPRPEGLSQQDFEVILKSLLNELILNFDQYFQELFDRYIDRLNELNAQRYNEWIKLNELKKAETENQDAVKQATIQFEKTTAMITQLKQNIIDCLVALSTNTVFFSGDLLNYRLALDGIKPTNDPQYGASFDVSRINRELANKLIYLVSSYQTAHSCGFHVLANAYAINKLAGERQPINSDAVRILAEDFIINRMVPQYGESVCIKFKDNVEIQKAARNFGILPGVARALGENLFILNANGDKPEFEFINAEEVIMVLSQEPTNPSVEEVLSLDLNKALLKTINEGIPTHFMVNYSGHWTLISVVKNAQGQLVIIYMDSRNPYPLYEKIIGGIKAIDQFIKKVKSKFGVANPGYAQAPVVGPGVAPIMPPRPKPQPEVFVPLPPRPKPRPEVLVPLPAPAPAPVPLPAPAPVPVPAPESSIKSGALGRERVDKAQELQALRDILDETNVYLHEADELLKNSREISIQEDKEAALSKREVLLRQINEARDVIVVFKDIIENALRAVLN